MRLALRVPAPVQLDALVVDARAIDNAMKVRGLVARATLTTTWAKSVNGDTETDALRAGFAGGPEEGATEAAPSSRQHRPELTRRDIGEDAHVMRRPSVWQIAARPGHFSTDVKCAHETRRFGFPFFYCPGVGGAGGGGNEPPSASVFMFDSARVNVAVRAALSFSRAASSGNIELSKISV